MPSVLVVEDEVSIQKLIKYDLEHENYQVVTCGDGLGVEEIIKNNSFDIILLDMMLPNKNGIEICKDIRMFDEDVYIILLTAVGDELSKLDAFNAGADDYVVKPFSMREVIARMNSALKRSRKNFEEVSFKHIRVNSVKRTVYLNEAEVKLTYTEYELLNYMLVNKNKVISRDELLEKIWGYDYAGETRTVDVYAHKIRDKLKLSDYLKTVHGIGYILKDE